MAEHRFRKAFRTRKPLEKQGSFILNGWQMDLFGLKRVAAVAGGFLTWPPLLRHGALAWCV